MRSDLPSADDYAAERARFSALEMIDIDALQRAVSASYSNRVLVDINGECLRLAVFEGEYRWHFHPDTDELFVVVAGELHIEFHGRAGAVLGPLQCMVVPAGTVHRTRAVGRTVNLTVERQGSAAVFVDPPSAADAR